jgi:hypothetical protein|nr:MAG TPA: protein of unknown function (DUF4494) [Caudoviricetes sp.]
MLHKYFEITISYWAEDENSASRRMKKCQNVIACSAINYTDAEAIATKWGNENIDVEFDISPIKEMNISGIHSGKGLWFLCKGLWFETDMRGKVKENKIQYLIQSESSTKASEMMSKILNQDFFSETRVVDIKETKIEEFITC